MRLTRDGTERLLQQGGVLLSVLSIVGAFLLYRPIFMKLGTRALCYADWAGFCEAFASPLPGGVLAWCANALALTWTLPLLGDFTWLLLAAGVALLGWRWAKLPPVAALLPAALGVWQVAYCGFSLWIFVGAAFPYLNLLGWGLLFLVLGIDRRRGLWSLAGLLLYPLCGTPIVLAQLICACQGRKRLWMRLLQIAAAGVPILLWKLCVSADPAWLRIVMANSPFLFEPGSLVWDLMLGAAFAVLPATPLLAASVRRLPAALPAAAALLPSAGLVLALYLGMDPVRPLYDLLTCERALARGDFRAVLELPETRAASHRMVGACYIYALWRTGELAERLFQIPWSVSHEASTIDTMELDGYTLLYHYGIVQLARRWAYESVVNKGWTADKYRLLARCALILGEDAMARRYALQLRRIPFRRAEADALLAVLDGGEADAELARVAGIHFRLARDPGAPVFEGDKRLEPGIYNRYAVLQNGSREMVTLYLCSALLRKDTLPFIENFEVIRTVWKERPLPRVFQEALLAAAATQPPGTQLPLTADLFSPGVPQAFSEFQRHMRNLVPGAPPPAELLRFRQTYWFYATFVP